MIKLMHVDDDPDIREIVDMSLGLSGDYVVLQCESGEEALAQMAAYGPDVLLFDVMLPGMTGAETLAEARRAPEFRDIPAIYMTGKSSAEDLRALRATGVNGIITKPFDPMTIGAEIKEILAKTIPVDA